MKNLYLGYRDEDFADNPYATFFNPEIEPFQDHVLHALLAGGMPHELMYPVERAGDMLEDGYWPIETGYATMPDGSLRVFCLTDMPRVSPKMWAWWFGWHGSQDRRYKLWHPKAHVSATWKDGRTDLRTYVGRISHIVEYLGSQLVKGAICFVPPARLGLDETILSKRGEVAICARIAFPNMPVKVGWLMHHVRPVKGGCEMRSRMWIGGKNIAFGDNPGFFGKALGAMLRPFAHLKRPDPAELLAHNAQEMLHLACFLPELYEAYKDTD